MSDRPRFADAHEELAVMARHLRDQRAANDPAHVDAGKMTAEQAGNRLRVATAPASDWQHIAAWTMPPASDVDDWEKRAMLEETVPIAKARAERARQAMIAEHGQGMAARTLMELWALCEAHLPCTQSVLPYLDAESQAAALEAMLWWARRDGDIWLIVQTNAQFREERQRALSQTRAA